MLGGSVLLNLETLLPEPIRQQVEISAIPCSDTCNQSSSLGHAPFVKVDGELLGNASVDMLIELLSQKILSTNASADVEGDGNE